MVEPIYIEPYLQRRRRVWRWKGRVALSAALIALLMGVYGVLGWRYALRAEPVPVMSTEEIQHLIDTCARN